MGSTTSSTTGAAMGSTTSSHHREPRWAPTISSKTGSTTSKGGSLNISTPSTAGQEKSSTSSVTEARQPHQPAQQPCVHDGVQPISTTGWTPASRRTGDRLGHERAAFATGMFNWPYGHRLNNRAYDQQRHGPMVERAVEAALVALRASRSKVRSRNRAKRPPPACRA